MSTGFQACLTFLGRIALALIFILAGFDKIMHFNDVLAVMTSKAVPYAEIALIISIIFELGGGLMVALGWYTRFGAFLLFLFIIPVTYYFHSFWTFDPNAVTNEMHHFLKNLSILGGCLYVMAYGAGCLSLDAAFGRNKK